MPTIHVEMFEGRTVEQKRAYAKALTEASVQTLGCSPDAVDVIFRDVAKQDWATGGVLWSDKAAAPPASGS
ncbi:MAG: 4-oxalocrotonate tautomerase [Proteobacteria bacterium]|nr:4-oxalocrotonate tautomerase [Pseudomonadota bacterium]